MSVLFKETNRQSKMKKRASADTRKWAPTEALRFWLKFDLYPGNLVAEGADKKTYEATYQCRLQDIKNAIFNPNHDIFSFLSVRLDA